MSTRWLTGGCSENPWHRRFPHYSVGSNLSCGLRSEPALVERLYPEMGLSSRARRFSRGVSLLAAVVVCLGAFLCFVPTELEICTALRAGHSYPLDRGVDEGFLAVAQEEEAWVADKVPLNADLLTMLVLGLCFGLSFGWVLTNTQRQEALCSLGELVGRSFAGACEDLSFQGVLRL
jgi:hypothetical protein